MKNIINYFTAIAILVFVFSFSACYYDNVERLNPRVVCDSTGTITYTGAIKSIIDNNCTYCHSGNTPSGGISLDTYLGVKNEAVTGKLYNSITWNNTPSPMPKNGNKIDDCSIIKIKKWIDTSYPQ